MIDATLLGDLTTESLRLRSRLCNFRGTPWDDVTVNFAANLPSESR